MTRTVNLFEIGWADIEKPAPQYDKKIWQKFFHIYTTCGRPEIASDVISSRNVKNVPGFILVHLEVASLRNIEENGGNFFTAAEADNQDEEVRSH